jgi:hypothetical protein
MVGAVDIYCSQVVSLALCYNPAEQVCLKDNSVEPADISGTGLSFSSFFPAF